MRLSSALIAIGISMLPVLAQAQNVVGFFETQPGVGGATKRLCIREASAKRFAVYIAAGYCPSEQCLNYRPDNIAFEGRLKKGRISYSDNKGCSLVLSFKNREVKILQSSLCRGSDHPYLYANGTYRYVKDSESEEDCGF